MGPRDDVEALTLAAARGNTSDAQTVIDATEGRTVFPMPATTRRFRSRAHMARVVNRGLGVDVDIAAADTTGGTSSGRVALRGSYVMYGSTYWTDPRTSVRYRVSDPIAASIGGVSGQVEVADEMLCVDPDGECVDGERASYLEPEGGFTAPNTTRIYGSNGVIATFHTFFNKTYFPWPWARHGNRTSINFAALPTTRVMASGHIWSWVAGMDVRSEMPSSFAYHHEVEVAVWTGWPGTLVFEAYAACGEGYVVDPDVNGSRRTGNGPENWSSCPG